jgi:hypothetical protein
MKETIFEKGTLNLIDLVEMAGAWSVLVSIPNCRPLTD